MKLKKSLIYLIVPILIFFIIISYTFQIIIFTANSRHNGCTIVLDAGHGGRDGGCVGENGTVEKDLNLIYSLALKQILSENNYKVILTRSSDDGLYSATAKNKKNSDMQARCNIINKANPNLVISIHMNSFADPRIKGASTYYRKNDTSGELCANYIQKALFNNSLSLNENSKIGDYYILNSTYYTAVLIECGYLSNPDEEKLLVSKEYMNKIVSAIFSGITLYFG